MRTDFIQAKEREVHQDERTKTYTLLDGDRYYDFISSANSAIMSAHEIILQPETSLPGYEIRYNKTIVYVLEGNVTYTNNASTEEIEIKENNVFSVSSPIVQQHVFHNRSKTKTVRLLVLLYASGLSSYFLPTSVTAQKTNFPTRELLFSERDAIAKPWETIIPMEIYRLTDQQTYAIKENHTIWLYLLKGTATINDQPMKQGDSLAIYEESNIQVTNAQDLAIMLIDIQQPCL